MVAHGEGVEAAVRLIAPALLGQDPRQVSVMEALMDHIVLGDGYAKAPFDAACWDILGKSCDQPVWMMPGGRHCDGIPTGFMFLHPLFFIFQCPQLYEYSCI